MRQQQCAAVTGGEQRFLILFTAPPDRPNRVDDIAGREAEAFRQYGLPSFAAADPAACGLQLARARGSKNGPADAAALL